jgi:hypothetical protein
MAKQKNNIIMRNTRGMVGKQIVFKKRAGVSYVSAPPEVKPGRIPTQEQAILQQRFREAVLYARTANADPVTKAMYQSAAKRGQSAFNVAFKDAFTSPEILEVTTRGYSGQPGDLIVVEANDDFKVNMVRIAILNSNGELVEEGFALPSASGLVWTYRAMQQVPSVLGFTIQVDVHDVPGSLTSTQVNLD